MEKGYVSVVIANLKAHQEDLKIVTGLTKDVEHIKKEALATLKQSTEALQALQQDLQKGAQTTQNHLQEALQLLKTHKAESEAHIEAAHQQALQSDKCLDQELKENKKAQTLFFNYQKQLHEEVLVLEKENAKLKVEAQKAKDQAEKYKKEKYYFLALGPFGLAGLATATALFATWSDKANKAKKAAARSNATLKQHYIFQENIKELQDGFGGSIDALSGVKNTFGFLIGSFNNLIENTNGTQQDTTVMSLFLNAAIHEANVLLLDLA